MGYGSKRKITKSLLQSHHGTTPHRLGTPSFANSIALTCAHAHCERGGPARLAQVCYMSLVPACRPYFTCAHAHCERGRGWLLLLICWLQTALHKFRSFHEFSSQVQLSPHHSHDDEDKTITGCPLWPSEGQPSLLVLGPFSSKSCHSPDISTHSCKSYQYHCLLHCGMCNSVDDRLCHWCI